MYTIKRYANGRFYDTETKNYITRSQISDLLTAGKKIKIVETKNNKDITSQITSQIQSRKAQQKKSKPAPRKKVKADSDNILVQLFRKGGDTLFDYGKKYASMWQDLFTMSKEEVDKLVNRLQKEKKISETEANNLKKEIQRYRDNIQKWITKNIDHRINDMLTRMNLANRDQVLELTAKIEDLNTKIEKLDLGKESKPKTKKQTA